MAVDQPTSRRDDEGFGFDDVEDGWNWLVDRIDHFQRRHRPLAFVWGVFKRYLEDSGNHFAALVSYYAFFSIFPLLLVLVTTLGIVLADHPELRQQIIDSAVAQFPVVGEQIAENSLDGHGILLAAGLIATLYAGLRAIDALQHAMNTMWNVPQYRRPNILKRKLRDLAVVGVLGLGVIAATVASGVGAFVPMPALGRTFSLVGTAAVNVAVLLMMFRLLTNCPLQIRRTLPGALLGGLSLMGLQVLGGVYVRDVVQEAGDTYGVFAVVLGLLTWVAVQARIVIVGSEVNVVWDDHLWPRGMSNRDPTDADLRAYRLSTERESRRAEHTDASGMPARPLDPA
jgi:YihY family inner membrane protein